MMTPPFVVFLTTALIFIEEYSCPEVDMRIGNKRTVLDRLDGTCGGDKTMKITFVAKSMKAQGKKIIMNATFHVLEDILDDTAITISITRCKVRENPDTCEHFHSFNTNQYCHLISTKSPLWSPFFDQITPPWRCPLMKGDYEVENAMFDVSSFLLFPVQGWFWRVTAEQRDLKTKQKIFCLITDTQVTTLGKIQ
ncbi:uncharacterized protein LOC123317454 [Coccinella septempunctata]|uniref:uncharacterized protein LOC123317454 n=1 Tax=Coccinella septempunctata TaxID=41139 RepID=UPI001D07C37A|nr:uncharacterized protein LOC123317454 [Coccinella septempunctata]